MTRYTLIILILICMSEAGASVPTDAVPVIRQSVQPAADLRDMLRQYIIRRSTAYIEQAAQQRRQAIQTGELQQYSRNLRQKIRMVYGSLPAGIGAEPIDVQQVSSFEKKGYRIENVLFDSFKGWQVNGSVFVPTEYEPPFPAVVIPVEHSGKQFANCQLPAQYFARCGYLALLFDPPGVVGEKQEGNDHFIDGVRPYLVGQTSSRYFVTDVIRCIDYLQARNDVDMSRGVAMTGVSGGGVTTILAALLDDRIAVTGPSCCVSPLTDLDITQCYAGCPETHMWRRYPLGIDDVDLLCGFAPKPTLLMAGKKDEVFRLEDTQRLAGQVKDLYEKSNASERFDFFVDDYGHGYTLTQARQFVRFMNRWLRGEPDRSLPGISDNEIMMDPYSELRCRPNLEVNMFTLSLEQGRRLEKQREFDPEKILQSAAMLAGYRQETISPAVKEGPPFRVWTHHWQQILLKPETDIELPATQLIAINNSGGAILHFDDQHRSRLIQSGGVLTKVIHFLENENKGHRLLSVDLRGWGDTYPALYPYEITFWGGIDRYLSYSTTSLGDPIMAMRVRDGLAALAYLQRQPDIDSQRIVITGNGMAGIVALHVAAINRNIKAVVVWDSLFSFLSLLEQKNYSWPQDVFWPNVLLHYDLPELVRALPVEVAILNPRDGEGKSMSSSVLDQFNSRAGRKIYHPCSDSETLVTTIQKLLETEK